MEDSAHARLIRGLRGWDLVALVINSIIGAGIFGLPSRVFALAGTYSLLAYVVSGAAIVLIILCFAEVGSRFKVTGGAYLYARVAFGPLMGFQVGWLMWLGRIAAFAALCNLFVGYLGYFLPAASTDSWRAVVIVAMISALAIANIVGVRVTAPSRTRSPSGSWYRSFLSLSSACSLSILSAIPSRPHAFVWTHARFHTPIVAILLTAMVSLFLTLFSTFISALTFSAVIRLIAYTTTCAALPVLRRNSRVPRPAFVAPAGRLTLWSRSR